MMGLPCHYATVAQWDNKHGQHGATWQACTTWKAWYSMASMVQYGKHGQHGATWKACTTWKAWCNMASMDNMDSCGKHMRHAV